MSMNPIDVMRIQDMINNAMKPLRNRIEDLEKQNKKLSYELSAIRSANICCCPSMFKCRIHSVDMFRVNEHRNEDRQQVLLADREVDETRRTRMIERVKSVDKKDKKKTQLMDGNELAQILKQSAPLVTRNVLNFSNINVNVEDVKKDFESPTVPELPAEELAEPMPLLPLYDEWLAEKYPESDETLSLPKLSMADIRRLSLDEDNIKTKTVEEDFNEFFGSNEDNKTEQEVVVEEKKEPNPVPEKVQEQVEEKKEDSKPVQQKKKKAKKSTPVANQDPNDLDRMKIDDLKAYCRANNIKGFSKYKKKIDLINFIRSHQ